MVRSPRSSRPLAECWAATLIFGCASKGTDVPLPFPDAGRPRRRSDCTPAPSQPDTPDTAPGDAWFCPTPTDGRRLSNSTSMAAEGVSQPPYTGRHSVPERGSDPDGFDCRDCPDASPSGVSVPADPVRGNRRAATDAGRRFCHRRRNSLLSHRGAARRHVGIAVDGAHSSTCAELARHSPV